ncbi:cache domain-containing sensor histidine kinase [Petroclostridium xylanilyticum]|jgi:two-component system sensor histidine kinase YesM|uniref:cache domain-containing sensor histidine kinase n=1 Tax=Petroclostridium xylanilyticum TaxID=1792311 RepID=UPI000B9925E6|nr:sensor histidine kinase [Petroclostridium xylanilyticum]
MRFIYSLRFKLIVLFLLSIVIPVLTLSFAMPFYYQNLMERETKILTASTLTAMAQNISTYLDDLERLTIMPYLNDDILFAVKLKARGEYEHSDEYARLIADRALNSTLPNFLQNTRKDILGFILFTYDNSLFAAWKHDYTQIIKDYPVSGQEWYREAVKADGKVAFIGLHTSDYFSPPNVTEVFSVARLIKDPNTHEPLGVIMADADTSIFGKMVSRIKFNVNSIVSILDHNGRLLYSNQPLSADIRSQIQKNAPIIKGEQDSYTLVAKNIEPADWKIVVLLSYSEIASRVRWMYTIGVLFAIGGLFVTFLLFSGLSHGIITPFKKMIEVMKKVEQGNLKIQFQTRGNDEIAQLGNALNNMIFKLNELIDREYRAILNQRNAEYHALQAQIQPHFLYNTLNGFIGLNRLGDRKMLEKAILSLTGMLRYILEHDDWTSIAEEFLFLQRYCGLQKLRFDDRMKVNIQFDDKIGSYKIPKLLLQPIVENAIIHGIEPLDRTCLIDIWAGLEQKNDQSLLKISVKDDGAGFDKSSQYIKPNIGLSNVQERLKMAYQDAIFEIESQIGSGTHVVITIPEKEVKR